jgi:hypothetical protein
MERVASLPCVICKFKCGETTYGREVHHARKAWERDDWAVVPLCVEHHRGATGVHGLHRKGFEAFWKVTDIQLLWTNKLLAAHQSRIV